jgi:hypothetical protein
MGIERPVAVKNVILCQGLLQTIFYFPYQLLAAAKQAASMSKSPCHAPIQQRIDQPSLA